MYITTINGVEFKLKEYQDFSWISNFGKVFSVIDETGSGCICFGIEQGKKYFYKIAGAKTIEADVSQEESIILLKNSVTIYKDIKHSNLIKLVNHFEYKEFYVVVFEWVDGECLFDHWNFNQYKEKNICSPAKRFEQLPILKKLNVVEILFSFFKAVIENNYVAVDFYDGSIMYNFSNDKVTICDIDLFRKKPAINNLGKDYPATKRLKAPEESILGAPIDEDTNVFTLGALLFDMFGIFTEKNKQDRYKKGYFIPCYLHDWTLNDESYYVLYRATQLDRSKRYRTIEEFYNAWNKSLNTDIKNI